MLQRAVNMRRLAATRACQFLWLLLGLTLVVEGRMLPTARPPNFFEPCKYTWQLPGRDCWPPIGQSPHCDHLYSEECRGSPPPIVATKTTAGADQIEALATEWEDPDCKPKPGRLPPIHCQDPPIRVTKGEFSRTAEWEDPDCKPKPGRLPPIHCQDPPVRLTKGDFSRTAVQEDPDYKPVPGRLPLVHWQDPPVRVTKGDFSHHVWTEVQEDRTDQQIHCEGCKNWPPTVTHHVNQDKTMTAAAMTELEDPDCKPVPGRLPPIHCQDPSMKVEGGSIQTAKVIEACQYTWQLPGTDCWPPIGQSPHCDHLYSEGCGDSPPTRN